MALSLPAVSCGLGGITDAYTRMSIFHGDSWDLNAHPHVCVARAFPYAAGSPALSILPIIVHNIPTEVGGW